MDRIYKNPLKMNALLLLVVVVMVTLPTSTSGFSTCASFSTIKPTTSQQQQQQQQPTTTSLKAGGGFGSSPKPSSSGGSSGRDGRKPPNQAEFEYQELKIQLNAMNTQKVITARLMPEKRNELEGYIRRVVNRKPSPIPMYDVAKYLSGTKWKLTFSTQSLVSDLPKDAMISLDFLNDTMMNYNLEFTKTLGLNKLTARSSYSVDSSPVNPGLVTYTYEKVTTDVFGISGIGVGMFGMLSGRQSYIPTVYFDGDIWIEAGTDQATGAEYFNVYTTQDGLL